MVARTEKEIENGRTKGRILVNDQAIIRIRTRIKKNNKRNGGSNTYAEEIELFYSNSNCSQQRYNK